MSIAGVQRRCDVFMQLMAMGRVDEVSCEVEKTSGLIKLFDAGFLLLSIAHFKAEIYCAISVHVPVVHVQPSS